MNLFVADGWLRDVVFRWTAGGKHEVVQLEVMVKDEGSDEDHRVTMWLRDEDLIARLREFLTKGRIVFVRASVRTEPTIDGRGGIVGDHMVFTVREIKVPNRSKPFDGAQGRSDAPPAEKEDAAA